MRNQPENSNKKKIVCVAAAAAASLAPMVAAMDGSPSNANAPTKQPTIHSTLWGNGVWDTNEVFALGPSSTLSIPRGGTDESSSKNKKDGTFKSKKSKKKTQKRNSKKDKAKAKDKERVEKEEEEEPAPTATNPMMAEILGKEDYYDILGLPRGEDDTSKIKKAYRRRAVQTHPDKTGGDRRAFDKLAEAYEVLLDSDKRTVYDRYGKAGLDPTRGPPASSTAEDMFRSFFGGQPRQPQGPINRTVRYQLQVTLEELYQGKPRQVAVEAPRGASFYAQFEPPARKKQVEVLIPRGAQPGQTVRLSGEMDFDSQDAPPGDLIFQLVARPHKTFTRKGHDLAMEQTISLQEAICGFNHRFQHLNGKYMTVESARHPVPPTTLSDLEPKEEEEDISEEEEAPPLTPTAEAANVYVQTGDVQVVKGKGMPKNAQGTEFGDLYIQYTVELPKAGATDNLTPSERLELARLLEKLEGKPTSSSKPNKDKVFQLERARPSDFGRASGPVPPMMEEEDPHHMHHEEEQQFPFAGMGHRQFFFSSTGRSPFFGQQQNFEDDENVQCRQM